MNRILIFRGICVAVVVASIVTIFWTASIAGRYAHPNVITVLPVMNDRSFLFRHDQIWAVSPDFNGRIEMEHRGNRQVFAGSRLAFANVYIVGQYYFDVAFLPFASGSAWTHDDTGSIIVDESLAWALFGGMDVVGLFVRIDDSYYQISGVVRDTGQTLGHIDGFAWMPLEQHDEFAILHFLPDYYNRLQSPLEVMHILELLSRRVANYIIVDVNVYMNSIALRGQLLLSVAGIVFIFVMMHFAYRIFDYGKQSGKQAKQWDNSTIRSSNSTTPLSRWVWILCITAACILVFALIAPYMAIDLWIPSFYPDGWRGYARMFFNHELTIPRQYLPSHLAILDHLNTRANWAFGIGAVGIAGTLITNKN